MDSWEWCRGHPLRHSRRPQRFQRPAREQQYFTEDTPWFRRNSPHIEPQLLDGILEQVRRSPSVASVAVQ
eukprot:1434554-Lingulodinium_polyedra.AAC.1